MCKGARVLQWYVRQCCETAVRRLESQHCQGYIIMDLLFVKWMRWSLRVLVVSSKSLGIRSVITVLRLFRRGRNLAGAHNLVVFVLAISWSQCALSVRWREIDQSCHVYEVYFLMSKCLTHG